MARRQLATLVLLALGTLLALSACGGKDLSAATVMQQSRTKFALHHTYVLQMHAVYSDELGSGAYDTKVAFRDDEVAYGTYSLSLELVGQDGIVEVTYIAPDLYAHMQDGSWYVLDPWSMGGHAPFDPTDRSISYVQLTRSITGYNRLSNEKIDGKTYLRYEGKVATNDLPFAPDDPGAPPASAANSGAVAGIWVNKSSYLPYKMEFTIPTSSASSIIVNLQFSDFGESQTPPQLPAGARPWRNLTLPDAPCTDDDFALCLQAQTTLEPIAGDCTGRGRRVCLAPIGRVSPDLVRSLVGYYRSQYDLSVTVLPPDPLPAHEVNLLREQVSADKLENYMLSLHPDLGADPQAVLIAITPIDVYSEESLDYNFIFGHKGTPANPKAVVSTFRMDPQTYSEPADNELFYSRARKFLSKYIGLLYFGLPPSSDPASPLFDSIGGVSDLDYMQEPLPIPAQ